MTLGVCPYCSRAIALRGHCIVNDGVRRLLFGELRPHVSAVGVPCEGGRSIGFVDEPPS